jgi:hypothetical protein
MISLDLFRFYKNFYEQLFVCISTKLQEMLIGPIINYSLHFKRVSTSKGGKGDTKGLQIKFRTPSGRKVQMWDLENQKAFSSLRNHKHYSSLFFHSQQNKEVLIYITIT